MATEWFFALLGGVLIGASATILLLTHSRIAGVSGILYGLITRPAADGFWRLWFIAGLLGAGFMFYQYDPTLFPSSVALPTPLVIAAGLLVGIGTKIGGGCTSGHGVCGISRFSFRSVVATVVFMAAGIATVYATKHLGLLAPILGS